MIALKSSIKFLAVASFAAILAGCSVHASTNTSALRAAPEPRAQVGTTSVNLDNRPADTIRAEQVIARSKAHVTRSGEVYLMRGLANVFSRGIDDMAVRLRQQGYDASNFSYAEWVPVAQDIVLRARSNSLSKPIIIIGHSLGGNESSKFANYLAQNGVDVDLVVTFDPVETGRVGPGIDKVVNYYLPKAANNVILPKAGFDGELKNIDVTVNPDITHTNVDKNADFQAAVFADLDRLTKPVSGKTERVRARRPTQR